MNEVAWTKYVAFMKRETKLSKKSRELLEKRKPVAPGSRPGRIRQTRSKELLPKHKRTPEITGGGQH